MNSFLSKLSGFFLLLCVVACNQVIAQNNKVNYAGKDFWLALQAVPGNINSTPKYIFYISSAHNANVTFDYTTPNLTKSYSLTANSILVIQLTSVEADALCYGANQLSDTVGNKSLHITADTDIVVQFLSYGGFSDDGIFLYPSDKQNYGQDYIFNSTKVMGSFTTPIYAGYSIVSRCDSVVLEITPSVSTRKHSVGVPFTVVMKKGDNYILSCYAASRDLSGTTVKVKYASCPNPINIFINHRDTYLVWPIPSVFNSRDCCTDQLMEQILPVSTWDITYPIVCFANNTFCLVKIVSAAANNTVLFDGVPIRTLSQNEGYDTIVRGAVVITATAPISVTQHMMSQSQAYLQLPFPYTTSNPIPTDSMSDPATLWPLSIRDGLHEAYFKIPNDTNTKKQGGAAYKLNYVTIISKANNIGRIALDNKYINTQFVPFPRNAGYMYANIKLDSPVNKIYHLVSKERILAYCYGAYQWGSYAYGIGDVANTSDSNNITLPPLPNDPNPPAPPDTTDPNPPQDTTDTPHTQIINVGSKIDVAFYPNPTTGIVNVISPADVNLSVSSLDGRLLLSNNKTKKIDISALSGGVYVIKVTDENGLPLMVQKIIRLE